MTATRRRYLATLGTGTALALAGCITEEEEDEGPAFLVTNTNYRKIGDGIEVQISVENGTAEDREAQLDIVLGHQALDDQWRKEPQIRLPSATEKQPRYMFDGIHEEGRDVDGYTVDAKLRK